MKNNEVIFSRVIRTVIQSLAIVITDVTVQDELDLERNHVGGCDQVEHGRGVLGPEGRGRLRVWEKFFHLLHLHDLANVDVGLPSQRGSIHLEES